MDDYSAIFFYILHRIIYGLGIGVLIFCLVNVFLPCNRGREKRVKPSSATQLK